MLKTCLFCRFWEPNASKISGRCKKITQTGETCNSEAVVQVPHALEGYLQTAPSFGCILFKPDLSAR